MPLDLEELKVELKEDDTAEKFKDYGMRIFTGSESLLRELKMSTPKERKNTSLKMMDI